MYWNILMSFCDLQSKLLLSGAVLGGQLSRICFPWITVSGHRKWSPKVVTDSGHRKWSPKVVTVSIFLFSVEPSLTSAVISGQLVTTSSMTVSESKRDHLKGGVWFPRVGAAYHQNYVLVCMITESFIGIGGLHDNVPWITIDLLVKEFCGCSQFGFSGMWHIYLNGWVGLVIRIITKKEKGSRSLLGMQLTPLYSSSSRHFQLSAYCIVDLCLGLVFCGQCTHFGFLLAKCWTED